MPRPARKRPRAAAPQLTLTQTAGFASIHPQLPPTPAWTYDGLTPGPVVVVDSGRALEVRHQHRIQGGLPFRHVVADSTVGTMNEPGTVGEVTIGPDAEESAAVAALKAHTVVHLHGGPSPADADGWAENVIDYGDFDDDELAFPREQWPAVTPHSSVMFRSGAAPMYWYHDHAMGVTRFNVFAGLAGVWLIRDPLEATLGLPTSAQHEIPLVLADRNLETLDGTPSGELTGRFLHKVETTVRECFAPVNLVNGLAWPRCRVTPRVHRLRMVNGSNARTYRLHLLALTSPSDPSPAPVPAAFVQQIGTDGGLLGTAIDLPADGLTLAPGERADVLVDFGALAKAGVKHVAVFNNAPAPFGGLPPQIPGPDEITGSDPVGYRSIPHVMRFDLSRGTPLTGLRGRPIQGLALDPDYRRVSHAQLPGHDHTMVALREEDEVLFGPDGLPIGNRTMLFLHELLPEDQANAQGLNLHADLVPTWDGTTLGSRPSGVRLTLPGNPMPWVSIGKRMHDASLVMIAQGSWHLWKVINLSPDTHPFHVHLTQFQATSRELLQIDLATSPSGADPLADDFVFTSALAAPLDANETGWKDTVRVNPGQRGAGDSILSAEMMTVAGCFASHSGRYLYHCHILEHEDLEMMRSFTVLPADIMVAMGAHHGH